MIDPHGVLVLLGVDDEHKTTLDWANRDEPVLVDRVRIVEYLQVLDARREQLGGLLEGDAVLLPVANVLGGVPCDLHRHMVSQ